MSLPLPTASSRRFDFGSLFVWAAAGALIAAGFYRYFQQPTFWLDEAFVAVSLLSPSPRGIFAQLEYGQLFPRIYLGAIAIVREVFGYRIWSLRLLPYLTFIAATLLWARILAGRSRTNIVSGFLAGGLLIGATFWLDQAIQVKQYALDTLLALAPFLIGDSFFKDTLVDGKRRVKLIAYALPCMLSYTYPFAMGARVLGWYLQQGRLSGWRLNRTAVLVLSLAVIAGLAAVWFTDHRFNINDSQSYLAYWNDCLLGVTLRQNAEAAPRLIAKFLWGWHGRQPFVTAVLVPLQVVAVFRVISRLKRREPDYGHSCWGSRPIGSLILLGGVILASAIVNFPICAGRVVLFAQIHTQLLALEGASVLLASKNRQRAALVFLWLCVGVVGFHSVRAFGRLVTTEPAENLRPVLSLINREQADAVLVLSCSVAQVRSLPDPLPVSRVVLSTRQARPPQGDKTWVVWTHLGNDDCVSELERIRSSARSWQVVNEGPGRGLALAEF